MTSLRIHPYPPIYAIPPAISSARIQTVSDLTSLVREIPKDLSKGQTVISPSQLSTFDRCNRRWAWENIAKFRSPQTPSQILGVRVHSVYEAWLRHGVPPDRRTLEGRIALRGIQNVPPPGSGWVEKQFWLQTRGGLFFTGIADWLGWHQVLGAVIIDHKSTSSLKWAKLPEELEFDVQALLYAVFACISMQTDRVTLRWNYVQTDAKAALPVQATLTLPQIIERFPIIENRAAEMTYHRLCNTHPMRLLPNPNACGDFKGCPHQNRCQLSPMEKMEAIMTNEANGTMRDAMTALAGYTQGQPAPAGQGGYPPGVAPVGNYLPQGGVMVQGQPAPAPSAQQQIAPYYLDPASGWLVDEQTRQLLPQGHPAYAHYAASLQAAQAPQQQQPAPQQAAPAQGYPQAVQPGPFAPPQQAPAAGPVGANVNGQYVQYPNYSPHSGPNAPEQNANPAQIPQQIPAPPVQVEGVEGPKKRGRKPKAAATEAAAGAPQTVEPDLFEVQAFVGGMQGLLSHPSFNPMNLTVEQLEYVGSAARAAYRKAFG